MSSEAVDSKKRRFQEQFTMFGENLAYSYKPADSCSPDYFSDFGIKITGGGGLVVKVAEYQC